MPASPHLERFSLDEDGATVDVIAIAHHTFDGHELVLLVPEDAFDEPGDDMDAWVREAHEDGGQRVLIDPPDEVVDAAWVLFQDVLSLTFSGPGDAQ